MPGEVLLSPPAAALSPRVESGAEMSEPGPKKSRVYLEETWLPFLGGHPPVLDIGKAGYTAHYPALANAAAYVTVDRDAQKGPDLVADVTAPGFVELARARHPAYGSAIFNGLIGYGIDSLAQIEASLQSLHALLRAGGHLLVGWNERDVLRLELIPLLQRLGFQLQLIQGLEVFEPAETEGFEHLQHHYMHWIKPR